MAAFGGTSDRHVCALIVEMALLTFRPLVQPAGVDNQLSGRVEFDVSAVHRARCGSFEVYAFVCVPAAVTGTLELVLRGFPVGGAAQVSATGVDYKQAFGVAHNPDPVLLLKLCFDTKAKVRRVTYAKNGARFLDR